MGTTLAFPARQFDDLRQQREAASLGMWVFIVAEILFFGGVILCYAAYRMRFGADFARAANHTNLALGTLNTAVLLTSSFTMALSVHSAREGKGRRLVGFLLGTAGLGVVFLAVKFLEYREHILDGMLPGPSFRFPDAEPAHAKLFFGFYFVMTAIHAIHLMVGIGVVGWLAFRARRGRTSSERYGPVEVSGLYWHFVDIVWIFLFPLLYLLGRHVH